MSTTTTRVAGKGRVNVGGHRHEGLERAVSLVAKRVREVSDECRHRAHMAVGTDPRSPRYDADGSRRTFRGALKYEVRRQVRRQAYRRSKLVRKGVKVQRFRARWRRNPMGALAMVLIRQPLQMLRTAFFVILLLAVVVALIWAALAPVRDAIGRIIPGTYAGDVCSLERPAGGIQGAAWVAGDGVRKVTTWEPDPAQMKAAMRGAANAAGRAVGAFSSAIDGVTGRPMEQLDPAALAQPTSAACGGPCFISPRPLTASAEGWDEVAQAVVAAGQTGEPAVELVAIAGAESMDPATGQPNREARNPSSSARGYFQVMTSVHNVTEAQAFDPLFAARFAVKLRDESPKGLAGPWAETYGKGLHQPHMATARAAVARAQAQAVQTAPAAPGGLQAAQGVPVGGCSAEEAPAVRQAGASGVQGPAGKNGRLAPADLYPLTWTAHQLRADAAQDAERLNQAYRAAFGRDISVTDSYRSYAAQVELKDRKPRLAAVPGTSNHGWGVALDLGGGVQTFGSRQHEWMKANAPAYGWVLPDWADRGGSKPEPWHWEYVGQGTSA